MRLSIDPDPGLPVFSKELDMVIRIEDSGIPEVIVDKDKPAPDRHLVLGMVQCVSMAAQENDPETFSRMEVASMQLLLPQARRTLGPGLIVVRARDGSFGALGVGDSSSVRTLVRKAVRYFTGTIRLDVP